LLINDIDSSMIEEVFVCEHIIDYLLDLLFIICDSTDGLMCV
jgi:hypothetical protein